MSTAYFAAMPTDPRWVPTKDQETAAVALFADFVHHRGDLVVEHDGRVHLYDAGGGFESARCPCCGAVIARNPADMTWWTAAIDAAWTKADGFWPLDVVTPCCDARTTLNDLRYDWTQGFATWAVRADRAEQWELPDWQQAELEAALGHPVRLVYTIR